MKVFIYILMILAVVLVVYNGTHIDFNDPFGDDSIVAVITAIAGLCALMVLAILRTSQKIKESLKRK
ncbi:MAG: hypothetical protein HKO90_08060 [Flavobacteriaceae bacterium]|nr:hypothetical protein [Flavobacteriaceae bacterium]